MAGALEELAVLQGRAGLPSASPACVPFWDRPYLHINPSLVPHITASLTDPAVASLPMGLGSIDRSRTMSISSWTRGVVADRL